MILEYLSNINFESQASVCLILWELFLAGLLLLPLPLPDTQNPEEIMPKLLTAKYVFF
jgi:hypothetical protein